MIKRISVALLAICTLLLYMSTSCEECNDCENGDCHDRICICDEGYFGIACEEDGRVRVPGSYTGSLTFFENGTVVQQDTSFVMDVRLETATGNTYFATNFANTGDTITFTIEYGGIQIASQALTPGRVSGSGNVGWDGTQVTLGWSLNWDRGNSQWRGEGMHFSE